MTPASLTHLEQQLESKFRELLSGIQAETVHTEDIARVFTASFDLLVRVQLRKGKKVNFHILCLNEPRPSEFPKPGLAPPPIGDIPVLAARKISERMAERCRRNGWSWFDLAGNCLITVPGFAYIERQGILPTFKLPSPKANLSTRESARILRTLLATANVGNRWTLRKLMLSCHPSISIGLASKVVSHLRDEAYLKEIADGGFELADPVGLLEAWRKATHFERQSRTGYFTLHHGKKLHQELAAFSANIAGYFAYASFSAADYQAPSVRQPRTWIYLDPVYEQQLTNCIAAKSVDSGENLLVLAPEDPGIFAELDNRVQDAPCTSPAQTYVDLCHSGGRGAEAAESLLEQVLKPLWKSHGLLQ